MVSYRRIAGLSPQVGSADCLFRQRLGKPTAQDIRTVKAVFGLSISEMRGMMFKPPRTIQRMLKGDVPVFPGAFALLLSGCSLKNPELFRFLKEHGGPRWWTRELIIETVPDGGRSIRFGEQAALTA